MNIDIHKTVKVEKPIKEKVKKVVQKKANKLDENTKDIVEKFINKINYSDSKFTDCDG